jgi:oligopeptide/dipeptide ABC transporter ATP-binding protein
MTTVDNRDILVQIKDLQTHFFLAEGVVRAVDGCDLTLRRSKTLGIVGESGCGKSMTAYSLMRLVPAPGKIVGGDILYYRSETNNNSAHTEVINIAKLDPNGRTIREIRGNQISMVFQEPMTAMSPILTVGRQMIEAIELHQKVEKKEARDIAIEMLSRVKMPRPERVVDDYPFQLSGGMRQRAVIAMALSCRPNLLIADEPTTALDVTTEAQILDLMRNLQQEFGMAIMYITHNLGVIAEMADEVAVMYLGKVVEQTDINSIFFNPLHPYTRGLLASIPQLDDAVRHEDRSKRLNVIKGMVPDPYTRLKGCPFHPRCPEFISGVCDQVMPALTEPTPGQLVRCHLYPQPSQVEIERT